MRIPTVGRANTGANTTARTGGAAAAPRPYVAKDYTGWTMQQANDWRNQVEQEINRRRSKGGDVSNWQRHFQDVSGYIRSLRNPTATPGQAPAPEAPPAQPPAQPPAYQSPADLQRDQGKIKYREAANRIKNLQPGTPEYDRNAAILKDLGTRFGWNWQNDIGAGWTPTPVQPAPTPAPEAAPPPVVEQPAQPAPAPEAAPAPAPEGAPPPVNPDQPVAPGFDWNNYQSPMTKALMDALGQGMNTMRAYEPKYFEGSPMYQFQKDKGSRDLERLLAARGLTGSGAEIEANTNFLTQLNATEAEKQRQYADQTAQRVQDAMRFIANYDQTERENLRNQANQNKDREVELSKFDATRNDDFRNFVLDSMLRNLGLQAGASPMSDIYNATGAQAGIFGDIANSIFNFQKTNFNPVIPNTGGAPAMTPPPPPGPDTTSIDLLRAGMDRQNAGGNTSVWNTVLSSIFGGR